ncbi:MAG: EamA family transporter [Bacteroidetes bacterium]|nr:EamA family transporter [Bacteroidota bacterium]
MESKNIKGVSLALFGAVLWGVSGNCAQFLFQHRGINIEWLITIRLLAAGLLLLCFAVRESGARVFAIWGNKRDALQLLIFSIGGMVAVQYTYFAAIRYSNAATATVLQYSGPILIAVWLALKYRRVPTPMELAAIGLAVAGTFVLVTHGNMHSLSISGLAVVFGLASAVTLVIYTLQPLGLLSRYPSAVVISWGMLFGGIVFSFIHAPWKVSGYWDVQTWLCVGFIVVMGTLVAFYSYMTAVKTIGGQKASLLSSAEPLAATMLSVLWLNTRWTFFDWIGSLCIIATVFLLSRVRAADSTR